ncbi:hypothetical protein NPX13_g11087 [Xylaria arbuscula]|uniref:SWIM-type domain-containing protein n=1 Tax=Xylaria arbuscula TaxID=114810 RepID=A0A9W8N3K4_9PEZI|nr:hypothetical protein NPX13_g11087 [Xylaria arbuscula]
MTRTRRQTGSSTMGASTTAKKRKLPSTWDEDESGVNAQSSKPKNIPKKTKKKKKEERKADEEKRLRRFREKAPASFEAIYERATSQRFYVLSRVRGGDPDCPEEDVEMTGSTGNIYHVHIAKLPSCDCPHALKGNQCKHIIYVTSNPTAGHVPRSPRTPRLSIPAGPAILRTARDLHACARHRDQRGQQQQQ